MLMMLKLQKEFGFKLAAFTHALEAYKIAPEMAAAGVGASMFADAWAYKMEVYDAIAYNAALSWRAGVLTSINTDTGSGMTPFNLDAAKAIRFGGVPPDEALKMVTINPAKQLLLDSRIGSLEVGKDGDVAIFEGHPLSVYSRCAMTLVDGEVFFQRKDAFALANGGRRAESVVVPSAEDLPFPTANGSPIAIVGGTVHTMAGQTVQNGGLVIEGDRITRILGSNESAPSGSVVVDAKGKHVFPGFFDAASSIGRQEVESFRSTVDVNDIGRFQPDLVALISVNPDSELIPVTRLGGITTALTRPTGPMVSGQGSLINLAGFTWEQMGVEPRAALYVNYPAGPESLPDFVLANLSPEDRKRREDTAKEQRAKLREYLEMAGRYAIARRDDPQGTPPDPRLEAMMPYVRGEKPVVFNASTSVAIREAVKMAKDLKLRMILSAGKEAWRVAPFLAENKVPVILTAAAVTALEAGGNSPSREYDPYDAYLCQPAVLHRAGVQFAFASGESSTSYELPMRAGLAVAYGLPYEAALRALTVEPAKIFGLSDRLGTLEPGKIANVVVYDGDPLEVTTQVRGLFIAGKPIPLESRWTKLRDKYAERLGR